MKTCITLLLAILFFFSITDLYAAEVRDTVSRQAGNRAQFTYDLTGEEADAEVTVSITVQGKTYKASDLHLEGDFGKVQTGRGKTIYWNVLQDFPRGLNSTIDWEIVAGGKEFVSKITGAKFIFIPPGNFMMGSPSNESGRTDDESQHRVTLTQGFYMQTTEVTQGQWQEVMGSNPSHFNNCGDNCPVEQVSWNDVQEFIRKLNQREGGNRYRLPTEAEWEYAARAGSTTAFANGGISELECGYDASLNAMGWYCGNADGKTHPVARKQPNTWGLYDMHGNVWEWCQDWYGNYPSGSVTDPQGSSSGSFRVLRGGGWNDGAWSCRSAGRGGRGPGRRSGALGFRLAFSPGQ